MDEPKLFLGWKQTDKSGYFARNSVFAHGGNLGY